MTSLWRVIDARYRADPLSTRGAFLFPGRWHSAGNEVLYCAQTESLARAERFVHLTQESGLDFVLLELALPADAVVERLEDLPVQAPNWSQPFSTEGRAAGDWWLDHSQALGLSVPSVLSTSERDVLLRGRSPQYPHIRVVRTTGFRFDPRLFKPRSPR